MKTSIGINVVLIVLIFSGFALSQTTKPGGELCHVYVVDVDKAVKALEEFDEKLESESQTVFPNFTTEVGEEVETAKTYSFPKNNWFIFAKVFYTDESLRSNYSGKNGKDKGTNQSIILTIAVSKKKKFKELSETINSSAEVTYDENTNKVRTKQFVVIDGRKYLIGLECDCASKQAKTL